MSRARYWKFKNTSALSSPESSQGGLEEQIQQAGLGFPHPSLPPWAPLLQNPEFTAESLLLEKRMVLPAPRVTASNEAEAALL